MIIISILQCILYLAFVPFCLGTVIAGQIDEKYNTVGNTLVFGFLSELAVFQVLFLLFYKFERTLTELTWVSSVILVLTSIVFLIIFIVRKDHKKIKLPKIDPGFGVFALFTIYMIVMRNLQGVNDGDDAFVIGNALTTYTNDVFYKVDYYTGFTITSDSFKRHLLASNPLFIAYLAKVTFIHPAILAHRVLGSFYLLLHNAVIYNISILLFEKDKAKYRSLFASFVSLLTIWDFHSYLTDSTFILSRTWQGKSMFCSLGIPVAILLLLMIGECRGKNNILFGAATILAISCIAMTPASIYLLTLFFMTGCTCVAVAVKKASVVIKALPMALSMAIIACLYMIYLN